MINKMEEGSNLPIKLPDNFHMTKYGIDVRLVQESDTPFILSLRSDKWLTRFIHPTDNDEQKQRQWIREYKKREAVGREYYFIYSKNGEPFGLNRIYNIQGKVCTGGSWLCKPGTDMALSIPIALILRDIMFDILKLQEDNFDVRKGNKKVIKYHLLSGSIITGETDLDILFRTTPESHVLGKNKILKLLNIKE